MANGHRTLNISVTSQLNAFVTSKVQSGDYRSVSEVVRDALQLLQDRDRGTKLAADQLKARIASGLAQARRGELVDGEAAFDELEHQLDEMIRGERRLGRGETRRVSRR